MRKTFNKLGTYNGNKEQSKKSSEIISRGKSDLNGFIISRHNVTNLKKGDDIIHKEESEEIYRHC